jgi:maleate cis-trans isomerase
MVLGHDNEQELIRNWEATYETRIFTSGTSHIDALRALNVRRFLLPRRYHPPNCSGSKCRRNCSAAPTR